MSGHSKWAQIKRQKAVTDQRRSGLFTKLANAITIAAKQGGTDPNMNFRLRMAIDKAKEGNMPNDNIDRAIQRAAGGEDGASIEEIVYEGYGPHGVALVIEAATDNKNRTASTIKQILAKNNASLGGPNSVMWMFDRKGVVLVAAAQIADADAFELRAIDAGADDIVRSPEGFTIYTSYDRLTALKKNLESTGCVVTSADIALVPQTTVPLSVKDASGIRTLLDELEHNEDVTNYYTNADV